MITITMDKPQSITNQEIRLMLLLHSYKSYNSEGEKIITLETADRKEIVELMGTSQAALSKTLKRLTQKGILEKLTNRLYVAHFYL